MSKELSEMSLEELWELFPIFLVEHKDAWSDDFVKIKTELQALLSQPNMRISHIGSTAVSGIWSKNIIDFLIEIPLNEPMEFVAKTIENGGFIRMSTTPNRISFNKGDTKNGFADKVYHVHLRYFGDNDELYFRDYLNEYPEVAKEYEKLKLSLWKQYEHNRDAYTEAKTDFVQRISKEARKKYGNRY